MKRIVIKIGSNVLTRADGHVDVTQMSALVDQVVWLRQNGHQVILVSSGAVACGRSILHTAHQLDSVEQRQLFSALGQVKLMELYYDLFREHGIHCGQVLTMKKNFQSEEERQNQRQCVEVMLENGVVPIVNENDTVAITELMFTDNDELSGLMATMMQAEALIILSNIDGIYDREPAAPAPSLITLFQAATVAASFVQQKKSSAGRGGMTSKLNIARTVAAQGISVTIANGKRPNILIDLIERAQETPHTAFEVTQREATPRRSPLAEAKQASRTLASMTDESRQAVLCAVADELDANQAEILAANALDLARMSESNPLYDRLQLTPQRLTDIANDMRHVAALTTPLGRTSAERTLPNGLQLRRVQVPFGVIGIIYEARPNVTYDVFALCFKTGNACVLKGGRDAQHTNLASVALIHRVLQRQGLDSRAVCLLPATHQATEEMLAAVDYVDLCIPRGGKKLIQAVRQNAQIPVIETGAGVVHCYLHEDADPAIAPGIICNAKTRRPSVCNSLDTLLVHRSQLAGLAQTLAPTTARGVKLYADAEAYEALKDTVANVELIADDDIYHTEWMSLAMSIRTVGSLEDAVQHIACYGSGHSETIVSRSPEACKLFQREVDAACVYANAPTSFTDGGQFGMGAEIGISTQKLGARGPMALAEITTYKWLIDGSGQLRA